LSKFRYAERQPAFINSLLIVAGALALAAVNKDAPPRPSAPFGAVPRRTPDAAIGFGGLADSVVEHQTAKDTTVGAEKPLGARGATMADTVGAVQTM